MLRVSHPEPSDVAHNGESGSNTTRPREAGVVADMLELYVRFRAKDVMPREGWLELLEVTMPKLEVGCVGVGCDLDWQYVVGYLSFPGTAGTCVRLLVAVAHIRVC